MSKIEASPNRNGAIYFVDLKKIKEKIEIIKRELSNDDGKILDNCEEILDIINDSMK